MSSTIVTSQNHANSRLPLFLILTSLKYSTGPRRTSLVDFVVFLKFRSCSAISPRPILPRLEISLESMMKSWIGTLSTVNVRNVILTGRSIQVSSVSTPSLAWLRARVTLLHFSFELYSGSPRCFASKIRHIIRSVVGILGRGRIEPKSPRYRGIAVELVGFSWLSDSS